MPPGSVRERVDMDSLQRRRSRIGLALGVVLSFCVVGGGCATSQSSAGTGGGGGRTRVYVGWVRFAGEFMLYPDAKSFAAGQTLTCVSGSLPLEKQKDAATQLSGKRVLVRARAVPWSPPGDSYSVDYDGSKITNWCGGRRVLIAEDMLVDARPASMAKADAKGAR